MWPVDRLRRLVHMPPREGNIREAVDAEIAFHLEATQREFVASGMSEEDARRAALRRFGDVERVRESLGTLDRRGARHASRGDFWSGCRHDLLRAVRTLRREPGFAAVVAITLALGVGANATMFGVVDRVLLRPAPHVRDDGTLSLLYFQRETPEFGRVTSTSQSYPAFGAMREQFAPLGDLGAWWVTSISSGSGQSATKLEVSLVTPNLLPMLGVRAWTGRLFDPDGWEEEGDATAVATHMFASTAFGSPASSIGQSIPIGGRTYTIVGVTPPGFVGPDLRPVDVFVSMPTAAATPMGTEWRTNINRRWLQIVARRSAGVSPTQAGDALTSALQHFGRANAKGDSTTAVIAGSIVRARGPNGTATGRVAFWLGGVASLVLLVACANVANLLLARATRRRRELAVHLALGISRARLVRALVTETLVLGMLAGTLALMLTSWGSAFLRATLLKEIPWAGGGLDVRQGLFVALGVLFAVLTAGFVPALVASRTAVLEALKTGARDGGGRRHKLRTTLVVVQGALSVLLMVGAGLFVRSFSRAASADLGFNPSGLVVATPDLTVITETPEEFEVRWLRLENEVRQLPGVTSVAQSVTVPFESQWNYAILLAGDTVGPLVGGGPYVNGVSSEYFETLQTPLRRGRLLSATDREGSSPVAVINERMSEQVWPGRDPIGQCFGIESFDGCVTVVGVVANSRMTQLADQIPAQYFVPIGQWHPRMRALFVRTTAQGGARDADIRRAIIGAQPTLPFVEVRDVSVILERETRSWKLGATMFSLFGVLGLVVAALGLYSVVAHDVAQRAHEMGVRMALGASRGNVARLVVGGGLRQTILGVALGVALSWAVSARVADLLFETSPRDPAIYGGVVALLLLVAIVASLLPARRAAALDPVDVLRD